MFENPLVQFGIYVLAAIAAGGLVGWLFAGKQISRLQESIDQVRSRLNTLTLVGDDRKEAAKCDEERFRLAYQQAADWVKLANSVTWTMSSIYLVGSLLALNGALAQHLIATPWRPRIGIAVVILSVIWLVFDVVYFVSARSARKWLAEKEALWDPSAHFFYRQYHRPGAVFGRWVVTLLLWASICVPATLGLIVAKPLLPEFVANLLVDI
jgi:hypothetical protein